jgi:hypothetical protein
MSDTKVDVPGWLTAGQLSVLSRLASEVPPGATMLEIGAFCGQASMALLEAAPRGTKLIAISAWDPPAKVDDRTPLRARGGKRAERTASEFREELGDHPVETIDSNRPILSIQQKKPELLYDLIFLFEGFHEVPLEVQVDFWHSKLKPMGLLCGADFVVGFRENVRTILRYATRKKVALGIEQNIWQIYNAV